MLTQEAVKALNDLCAAADSLCEIAGTAARNGKSLGGRGFYAGKFHSAVIKVERLATRARGAFLRPWPGRLPVVV